MDESLHPEVSLLNRVLALPVAEQAAFLQGACGEDAVLRNEVAALLAAHKRAEGFLEESASRLPLPRRDEAAVVITEKADDQIGRYKLVQPLGEGGCGVVYLAKQEEPVRRQVALKIIKLGMDTKSVIARFEAERQALALMDHPNIAKVFDAGATETGRPYFVMELVPGAKLTDYCRENNVSTETRLRLFTQVCQAIQHAHQKGIIHRDIKPSNVLVAVQDGAPVPKVIDFGIAKATQGRLTDQTLFTAFEQFIGTPAYTSPEQAAMAGVDIDTRTDIYSLGVLLYELLTGKTPFDGQELLKSGLDEMRRTIREKEPMRPSTCLTQELVAADVRRRCSGAADPSPLSPRRLQEQIHLLRGDLDWIVMKCLEKDRARRYETANGVALDIERHLHHEPVSARPPSAIYRLAKAIRRNKLVFAAISVLVVALVIVAVGSSVAAWRVAGARRAEQGEREKAEAANLQLRSTVRQLELERAEDLFRGHDAAQGVAHLAAMLRRDPSNHIAANRLVSALLHRDWALPVAAPMRHAGPVESAAFSPDGQRVLTTSRDGTAMVWDAATGNVVATVPHGGRIFHSSYGPDGTRFVTASADGAARVWSATNGSLLVPALTHTSRVYWAEFSADGRCVVTASADRTARVWDAANGRLLRELRGHGSHLIVAHFNPMDWRRVVTGGSHGSIRLWNVDTAETLIRVEDRRTNLTSLAFSPDGRRLVVACADGIARLWDTDTGQSVARPLTHRDTIEHAVFSPDSRLILTTSHDGTARLWEADSGFPASPPLVHRGGVIFGAFSPDGHKVVTTSMDNSARLWDVQTGTLLAQPMREQERILHADFSPDGRRLVTASYNWHARLWDIQPRHAAALELHAEQRVSSVTFSPDGNDLLTSGEGGMARQWEVVTGRPRGEPIRQAQWIYHAAFSPDGRQIVTASTSRRTHVWDAVNGQIIAGPFQHAKGLWFAGFSPDGGRVVTASEDGTARVWNIRTSEPVTPPLVHPGAVKLARFSSDGRRVLTLSQEHVRVWDAQSGAAVTDPLAHIDHVKWADMSPDGERVVTASTDNTACIWDVRTSKPAAPLLRHARIVQRAIFSPDAHRVATTSIDGTARIWDARSGQALTPALSHDGAVMHICFSPDGRRVLSLDAKGSARIWDVDTGQPLTEWFDGRRGDSACFDPSGERIAIGGVGAHLWTMPPSPVPVPEWFAGFAEAVAGIRLEARGNVELVPVLEFNPTAQTPQGAGDFYRRVAAWFLADPGNRPPSPF